MTARVQFYLREEAPDGYTYTSIPVLGPKVGRVEIASAPQLGDLCHLTGVGRVRVIQRSWMHARWGSVDWPTAEPRPVVPPLLDLIVVKADGTFVDAVTNVTGEHDFLRGLVAAFVDPSDCRFDHHGTCQEHLAGTYRGRCPHAVAKEHLARVLDEEQEP